jgi:hypothetical protein
MRGKGRDIESEAGKNRATGGSTRGSRIAFALALTALMVGTFVSFGALSYAGTASKSAIHTIKAVATGHKVVVRHSSAGAQYPPKPPKPRTHHQKFTPPNDGTPPGSTGTVVQQGTLPFTGLSLVGTALVSGLLLLLGFALRRRERRSE